MPQSVKGVVRDAAGQPVVGAAVIVKGTTRGVSSGTDGSFSFEGLADGAVLQVSALGYATAEIPVGNRSFVTVELKEDATLVDEVVVVGYGTQKKANLTGAVDQVSSELLENRPVANVTQMLQGAVPNLNISLADGKPNRSASYNIRGKTSIGAGGSALVLIDGVEGDPAMLNPNDIESVSVLKDAASAAIYGSRAPYGVVLITTKDPGKLTDKFTINYTGNVSIQQPTAIPDVVDDGYVYSRLFYDAWYNYRFNEPTGFNNSQDFSRAWLDTFRQRKLAGNKLETTVEPDGKYVYYGNTDYYDALYKDTVIAQTHNISVSGSNGKISHYLSGRLYDYNGLFNFTPDTYRTMNLRSKVSSQVFKWLKISNNFDYTHDRYRQPMGYSKEGGGVLWRSLNDQGHPSSPIFNPDGTLTKSGAYAIGGLVTGNNWLDRTTKTLKNTTTLNVTMLENRLRLTGDFSFRTKDYTETKKTTAIPYSAYEGEIVYLGTPETDDVIRRVRGHLRRETLFQGAGRLQLRAAGLQVDLLRAQRPSDARRRQHQLRAGRHHVDHRRRQPLALRGRFLPLQLRLRRPLPARSQRPLRRLVEISEQLPMGLLPLGFGRLARFAGEVLERQPQGRFEPQAARLVRCAGQQQRRSLHLPRNLRPVDLRNRFGRRGPLPLRAGQAALHEPPGPDSRQHRLGDLQNLRRGTGRRFPERTAEPHGRLLHPQDGGHVHRRPDASRHLRPPRATTPT